MKISKICFVISQITLLLLIISCSNSEESSEQGVIKETQEKIAQEAVDYIKVPLDQAKAASELANEHTRQLEEALKKE